MYVILVYDFGEKRVGKMLKLCRRYLNRIQNSVFEGDITEIKLKQLIACAENFMDKNEDSIIVFKNETSTYTDKIIIGKEKLPIDRFI